MKYKFLKIDEDGYPMSDEGLRLNDAEFTRSVFSNISRGDFGAWKTRQGEHEILLEAFDEPLVARQIHFENGHWLIECVQGYKAEFELESLSLDPWDRFHGHTKSKVSFVLSRPAQAEFFNLLDDFDDDTITSGGKTLTMENWLIDNSQASEPGFWNERYVTEDTPWDQSAANTTLVHYLPKLKLAKSKVAVLGCGRGHDAAHFAQAGHLVEAFDFDDRAIEIAKSLYPLPGLCFAQKDVFKLLPEAHESFDLVFEHTLYCAISPSQRPELVDVWRQTLRRKGFLLGVFFCFDKPTGPPFGGSEWELRKRLEKHFDFLYWQRSRHSTDKRMGTELFVLAQKK